MRALGGAVLLAALCLAPALAREAWAGPAADRLLAGIDQVLKLLDDPEFKQAAMAQERQEAIRRFADEIFDYEEVARRSLARHWEARTPVEREEFVQVLRALLERLFVSKLDLYNGEKIAVVGDTIDGDEATVKTLVVTKQGDQFPVDYRMVRRGDRWRAWDIEVGGVSLVKNYRAQFDKIIQRTSYQQLVKQVREKQ